MCLSHSKGWYPTYLQFIYYIWCIMVHPHSYLVYRLTGMDQSSYKLSLFPLTRMLSIENSFTYIKWSCDRCGHSSCHSSRHTMRDRMVLTRCIQPVLSDLVNHEVKALKRYVHCYLKIGVSVRVRGKMGVYHKRKKQYSKS